MTFDRDPFPSLISDVSSAQATGIAKRQIGKLLKSPRSPAGTEASLLRFLTARKGDVRAAKKMQLDRPEY